MHKQRTASIQFLILQLVIGCTFQFEKCGILPKFFFCFWNIALFPINTKLENWFLWLRPRRRLLHHKCNWLWLHWKYICLETSSSRKQNPFAWL